MTVGEKIKFARTLADVTQKELASLTGISEGQIKQYEINTRVPRKEKLESIASALGISKAFFINHNPSESNQKPKQIKYKNFKAEFKKLEAEQAKLKEEQTQISVILNLIADKFSHCKNINEVAEAVQDIKTLTRN